ncbi:agglutinin-2-like [Glycine soja]|uniref:agglutinin-2-like n=1 Tax=Glycine soja TaxID=3848 RepID=UPI00103D955F|nr:agglutinin-2-like [Glycine soja]
MAKTQNSFHILMVSLCFVLLINNVKSDSLSLRFPNFAPRQNSNIGFLGDERPLDGAIQLRRRDNNVPSVGCAVYIPQVHLWDKTTGKLANLETSFSFVVDYYSAGFEIHVDGLSFFIIPFDADPSIPKNSSGGYLGLFSPETTFNAYKSQIVATALEMNGIPNLIRYYADVKELSVVVGYFNTQPATIVRVLQSIDLRAVLPESVRIGFSGATGDKVETHDILSWSFNSRI